MTTHYASLGSSLPYAYEAAAHSFTPVPLASPFRSLHEVLDSSLDDQTVWEWERFCFSYAYANANDDGDGTCTWILHALFRGSLVIVIAQDGSYILC